jgi:hypothetical protein
MNTFVIKSNLHGIKGGKYIGLTKTDDFQFVYIFRSHEVFKAANPDLKDYEVVNDLKPQFDFKEHNVCPICGGLKYFYKVSCDKPMNGNILYDEDGFTLFDEEIVVNCICDDGTYVGYLEHELRMAERNAKEITDELSTQLLGLQLYVKSKSTCKTCKGDQNTMYNHEKCIECGLPGTRRFIAGG